MTKKLAILLLIAAPVLAACGSKRTGAPGPIGASGATSPRTATEAFLAAAKAQDLQALSLIWGSQAGPARATMPREELERREVVMLCHLRHETHEILEEGSLLGQQRRLVVELTQGKITRRTSIVTEPTQSGAWYVLSVDLEPLQDLCAAGR
ncbi:MAG TPA: hypothetical protein VFT96_09870 [Gemmatimonadaceae bacterium]|nr:hypothetical protein [Gemmatimonadaceae bacterium]